MGGPVGGTHMAREKRSLVKCRDATVLLADVRARLGRQTTHGTYWSETTHCRDLRPSRERRYIMLHHVHVCSTRVDIESTRADSPHVRPQRAGRIAHACAGMARAWVRACTTPAMAAPRRRAAAWLLTFQNCEPWVCARSVRLVGGTLLVPFVAWAPGWVPWAHAGPWGTARWLSR